MNLPYLRVYRVIRSIGVGPWTFVAPRTPFSRFHSIVSRQIFIKRYGGIPFGGALSRVDLFSYISNGRMIGARKKRGKLQRLQAAKIKFCRYFRLVFHLGTNGRFVRDSLKMDKEKLEAERNERFLLVLGGAQNPGSELKITYRSFTGS